jgi:hypothetical protein
MSNWCLSKSGPTLYETFLLYNNALDIHTESQEQEQRKKICEINRKYQAAVRFIKKMMMENLQILKEEKRKQEDHANEISSLNAKLSSLKDENSMLKSSLKQNEERFHNRKKKNEERLQNRKRKNQEEEENQEEYIDICS